MSVLLLSVYVFASTAGLLVLKRADEILSWQFAAGSALYGAGFLIWIWLLRRLPLSTAFPVAAGALIAATVLSGHWLLHEKLSATQTAGVALIMAGILLVFSRSAPQ